MQFAGLETIQYFKRSFFSRNSLALALQFAGLALTFGCNILLARFYGDQNYGIFSLVSGWAVLFSIAGLFGMDDRHLARVPPLNLKENRTGVKHELFSSLKINLVSAILSVVLFFILIRFFLKKAGRKYLQRAGSILATPVWFLKKEGACRLPYWKITWTSPCC